MKMSRFLQRITSHTKNQGNRKGNKNGHSIDADIEMTEILALSDENVIAAIIKMSRNYTHLLLGPTWHYH